MQFKEALEKVKETQIRKRQEQREAQKKVFEIEKQKIQIEYNIKRAKQGVLGQDEH